MEKHLPCFILYIDRKALDDRDSAISTVESRLLLSSLINLRLNSVFQILCFPLLFTSRSRRR